MRNLVSCKTCTSARSIQAGKKDWHSRQAQVERRWILSEHSVLYLHAWTSQEELPLPRIISQESCFHSTHTWNSRLPRSPSRKAFIALWYLISFHVKMVQNIEEKNTWWVDNIIIICIYCVFKDCGTKGSFTLSEIGRISRENMTKLMDIFRFGSIRKDLKNALSLIEAPRLYTSGIINFRNDSNKALIQSIENETTFVLNKGNLLDTSGYRIRLIYWNIPSARTYSLLYNVCAYLLPPNTDVMCTLKGGSILWCDIF